MPYNQLLIVWIIQGTSISEATYQFLLESDLLQRFLMKAVLKKLELHVLILSLMCCRF